MSLLSFLISEHDIPLHFCRSVISLNVVVFCVRTYASVVSHSMIFGTFLCSCKGYCFLNHFL